MAFKKIDSTFLTFLLVGGSAFLLDYLLYTFLLWIIGVSSTKVGYAKFTSFVICTVYAYVLNKTFTFKKKGYTFNEIIRFVLFYAVSALINATIAATIFYFSHDKLWGFIVATGVGLPFNFFCLKYFVFK